MIKDIYYNLVEFIEKYFFPFKPVAGTSDEWKKYKETCMKDHRVKYFFIVQITDYLATGYIFYRKIFEFYKFIRYRINPNVQYHKINTGLKPGYHEIDERLLYGCFSLLVYFVDREKAYDQRMWYDDNKKKISFFEEFNFRDPEAGLRYITREAALNKTASLTDTEKLWREVYELYVWWKVTRPARLPAEERSGWESTRGLFPTTKNRTKKQQKKISTALNRMALIERQYTNEDTKMLVKLIKIRGSLWS